MIDTHCHLTEPVLRTRLNDVIRRAVDAGVSGFVVPGVDLADSTDAISLARGRTGLRPAAGIHPMWADFANDAGCRRAVRQIGDLIDSNRDVVAAIGEIGLDDEKGPGGSLVNLSTRALAFKLQLDLARDLGLPVIVHSRGPTSKLVETLRAFGPLPVGGVLHAFGGSPETMRELRKLGYVRGVAGTVTRPGATRLAAAIRATDPADMVLETDAPFIANAIHGRGETVPEDLELTARAIAELTGVDLSVVIRKTDENARRIFGF